MRFCSNECRCSACVARRSAAPMRSCAAESSLSSRSARSCACCDAIFIARISACRLSSVESRRGTSTCALRASAIACAACVAARSAMRLRLQRSSLQICFQLSTCDLLVASCFRHFLERGVTSRLRLHRSGLRCCMLTLRIRSIARTNRLRRSRHAKTPRPPHAPAPSRPPLPFLGLRRFSTQVLAAPFSAFLAPLPPTQSSPGRKQKLPLPHPWSPPRPRSETHRYSQSMREEVAVATASAVDVHGSGRRGPDHHKGVLVGVFALATWFAPRRSAGGRGRTFFQLALVLRVLTLTPPPTVLAGQPAPIPDATPCRSSQTSALGELQTGDTMLGKQLAGVRFTSAQRAKQHSAH